MAPGLHAPNDMRTRSTCRHTCTSKQQKCERCIALASAQLPTYALGWAGGEAIQLQKQTVLDCPIAEDLLCERTQYPAGECNFVHFTILQPASMAPKRKAAGDAPVATTAEQPPAAPRRTQRKTAAKAETSHALDADAGTAGTAPPPKRRSRTTERPAAAAAEEPAPGAVNDTSAGRKGRGSSSTGPSRQSAAATAAPTAPAARAAEGSEPRVNARGVAVPFVPTAGPDTVARIARGERCTSVSPPACVLCRA